MNGASDALRSDATSLNADILPLAKERTAVELQAIQSRIFEKSYKDIFRATIYFLQDAKYKISFTDFNAGVIHAQESIRQVSLGTKQIDSLEAARIAGLAVSQGSNTASYFASPYYFYPKPAWYQSIPIIGSAISSFTTAFDALTSNSTTTAFESRAISISIDEQGMAGTRIRVAITSDLIFRSGADIYALADDLTDKPEIYQDIFAKIDKAAYLVENTR